MKLRNVKVRELKNSKISSKFQKKLELQKRREETRLKMEQRRLKSLASV